MTDTDGPVQIGPAVPGPAAEPDPDLALLRRYEPILAYTAGERFFPVGVEDYVRCCALRCGDEELVPAGELDTDILVATARRYPESRLSLLLVQEPFDRRGVRRYGHARPQIAKSGRLAAVGLFGCVGAAVSAFSYGSAHGYDWSGLFVGLLLTTVAIGWGLFARAQRELVASLHERAARLENEHRLYAEQARDAERRRIAMLLGEGEDEGGRLAVLVNGDRRACRFRLPVRDGWRWEVAEPVPPGFSGPVPGRSVLFMVERRTPPS